MIGGDGPGPVTGEGSVLLVDGLDVRFAVTTPDGRSTVYAVKDLSFQISRRTTCGLVGESGSGKSTVAGVLTGLVKPDNGEAMLDGNDVFGGRGAAEKALRRRISLVFRFRTRR